VPWKTAHANPAMASKVADSNRTSRWKVADLNPATSSKVADSNRAVR
jgi:hypothetical protein